MPRWWLRLRKRRGLDRDLADEIAFHREMRAGDEAAPSFGNETRIREDLRDMWTFVRLESAWRDVRYAFRAMRRNPGFASAAILSLALGIGASVAIFTVVDNLLLRPLPYRDPGSLVMVWEVHTAKQRRNNVVSPANYLDWKTQVRAFSEMAGLGFQYTTSFLQEGGFAEEIWFRRATAEFFPLLGVQPAIGRVFTPDDDRPGAAPVAVISDRLWRTRFAADPAVPGRVVRLGGEPATIIGVLPPEFYFLDREVDVWMPLGLDPARNYRATAGRFMSCVARLRPGASLDQAKAEMAALGRRLASAYPAFNTGWSATVESLRETLVHNVKTSLYVLLSAVALLLAVACANVSNLLLTRFSARHHELGVRMSIGAGRWRITRQVLTECAALGISGGLGGILVANIALRLLLRLAPKDLQWAGAMSVDGRALAFGLTVSLAAGLLTGLAPAILAADTRAGQWMRLDQRTGSASQRLRWMLVSAEVAWGVLLVIGAGLLFQTLVRLQAAPSGYDARNLLTMKVALSGPNYESAKVCARFFDETIRRLRVLPGVQSAAAVSFIPLHGFPAATSVKIEGHPDPGPGNAPSAAVRVVTPGYLRAAGIPLRLGREFQSGDNRPEAPLRFMVNQAFVDEYMRGENPIGRRISVAMAPENPFGEIIGVTGDISERSREHGARPIVYYAHAHLAFPSLMILVRTAMPPQAVALAAQRIVRDLEPSTTVSEVASMEQVLGDTIGRERFSASLLGVFSGFALLLTAIGIYGVLAYTVSERTREIGVRIALGAPASAITSMFIGKALRFTVAGVLCGLAGALALSRVLAALLFETSPRDPVAFSLAPAVLVVVAVVASGIPALRGARLNAVDALRVN
jgi:putative ABC transport system permease protein